MPATNATEPLWTREFLLAALANLALFTSFYFLLPTLPAFVSGPLHGDESQVGFVIGAMSLTAVASRPFGGRLLDTLGRRPVLIGAMAAYVLGAALYPLAGSLGALIALRAYHGVTWGTTTTSMSTVAADIVPAARRGEGLGYFGLANTLAMALGPPLGLALLDRHGFPWLFRGSLAVAGVALLASILLRPPLRLDRSREKEAGGWRRLLEPRVFPLAAVMFFTAAVYGGVISFITLYAPRLGVDNPGLFFFVYAGTLLVVRPLAGRIFDRRGPAALMGCGFLAIAASFVVLGLARGPVGFLVAASVLGLGFGVVHPTSLALTVQHVSPQRRGAANGTVFSAFDLGIGLGSVLLGRVASAHGLATMYLLCAGLTVVPLALFYALELPAVRAQRREAPAAPR